jgi:putative membrane protein
MIKQVSVALATVAVMAGLAGAASAQHSMSPMHHSNTAGNVMDRQFTTMAAMGGTAEIALSQLAIRKASSPAVQKFARMMVHDHTAMGSGLAVTARSNHLPAPMRLDAKHRAIRARLQRLSGRRFDTAYMNAMIDDHAKTVGLFQNEMAHGQNIHVTNLATKNLKTVQDHLQMAHDLTGTQSKMGAKVKMPPTKM